MSAKNIGTMDRSYYIKLAICIVIPLLVLLIPTSEVFTVLIRRYLAITLFGILMFLFEIMHGPVVALTLAAGYAIFAVADLNVVLSSWAHSIVYQTFLCTLILEAVNTTNLLQRISANLVIRVGGSYFGILLALSLASLVISFLIPSAVTTLLMVGIGYSLCLALGLKPNDNAAAGIMMMAGIGVCEGLNLFYSPTGIGLSLAMSGASAGWLEIIKDNIVFLPLMVLFPFAFSKIYKSDSLSSVDYFKSELSKLGAMDGREKKTIVILLLMILYMFTSQWHGMNMAFGFAIAAILLFFPALGIADKTAFQRVDMGLPCLVASCMAIGVVGNSIGVGDALGSVLLPFLQGTNSTIVFVLTIWTSGVFANILMTPVAMYTMLCSFMGPIAETLGYSAKVVAYIIYHAGNNVFFPYENNVILIMYGFGMLSMKQFIKGGVVKMLIDIAVICLLAVPWWMVLGLL